MPLQRLGDTTLLLRGSPHTLIVTLEDHVAVIDPGHGSKRTKQLAKELRNLGKGETTVLLTHSHSDHSNNACKIPSQSVLAPPAELPALHHPRLRTALTFGLPLREGDLLMMTPEPVPCAQALKKPSRELEQLPLPGHTVGQTGFATPDDIVYAADSLFGDQVLARYGVLYHMDTFQALETLKKTLASLARRGYTIVPSHGPPAREQEAEQMVQANIERLEDTINAVKNLLANKPHTLPQLVAQMHRRYGVGATPTSSLLFETGLRGILARLYETGEVTTTLTGEGLAWRLSKS